MSNNPLCSVLHWALHPLGPAAADPGFCIRWTRCCPSQNILVFTEFSGNGFDSTVPLAGNREEPAADTTRCPRPMRLGSLWDLKPERRLFLVQLT